MPTLQHQLETGLTSYERHYAALEQKGEAPQIIRKARMFLEKIREETGKGDKRGDQKLQKTSSE